MSKVYLKVELSIIVDTDLQGADNIMDNIDINVTSNSENVDVMDSEVNNFQITDAK
jgi:hypothetical protein